MRARDGFRLLALLGLSTVTIWASTALAQSPADQYLAGCKRACVGEVTDLIGAQNADGTCGRYCSCNLDNLQSRLGPREAARLELDLQDPATLTAINAARAECVQKILVPLIER